MATILVIEDDITVQTLISKLLQSEGFTVLSASNGYEGVQLALDQRLDLIISDIMMPGCNGYEVLEQLRRDPETARIPFIFLSAKSDRTDLRQGMELGADDYITKPFTRNELLGAITARLSKQTAITQPYLDEMKRAADSLSHMAYRDPLTGLSNRILLHHRLRETLRRSNRSSSLIAILCINLDDFQSINASFGYGNGDTLLQAVAARLQATLGKEGIILARLNGDEFCVVVGDLPSQQAISELLQRCLLSLSEVYQLEEHYLNVQASIGVAISPDHGDSPEQLLHRADIAMRHAKQRTRGKYQIYTHEMDLIATERRSLGSQLGGALERGEFQLYYQPQIKLITGRIIGAEALLRWEHPELGVLYPNKFIPIAEEIGLIIPLGQWILYTACQQTKAWQEANRMPFRISVNLSARQFKQPNLVESIKQVLQETQLDPDSLILEMTETSVMEDVETAITLLEKLKAMGVNLSIDDFGTGYSSLNYLMRFPLDTLKIDQSFVRDVTTDANASAIAKAILAMAHSMQLRVIAEGVETEDQLNFLRQNGCYGMQGYLFSPPVKADRLAEMLLADRRL